MNNTTKTVLVVGNGGREHAMLNSIKSSSLLKKLYTTSESFADIAEFININANNYLLLSHFCKNNEVDLVIIGPENYLADGLSDILIAENIDVFGPTKNAAKLESSKAFAKEVAEMNGVPIAKSCHFVQPSLAKQYASKMNGKIVVKANGLAGGKGVIICNNADESYDAIDRILINKEFGNSGDSLIIEEYLEGNEISFFVLSDGKNIVYLGCAKDYKHVYKDGKILNTGGMGTYSNNNLISIQTQQRIIREIIYPTINGLSVVGIPYTGILFAGIMLTKSGPKLLEYNARFGDPEAQVLLTRMKSDFLAIALKTVQGKLGDIKIEFYDNSALCVVMASNGYPTHYETGFELHGIEDASKADGVQIFRAGVEAKNGKFYSAGGRVLNVVAVADTLKLSREKAYSCINKYLKNDHLFYLNDIDENVE